jgi:hypothetical protein
MTGSVFHIVVRRVNQVAQIIQWKNILCQYVGDYKKCNELASCQRMMFKNRRMGRGCGEKGYTYMTATTESQVHQVASHHCYPWEHQMAASSPERLCLDPEPPYSPQSHKLSVAAPVQ